MSRDLLGGIGGGSVRQRAVAVSLVLHLGLLGLLAAPAARAPLPTSSPLRVRLLEPPPLPAPSVPPPVPSAPEGGKRPAVPATPSVPGKAPAPPRTRAPDRPPALVRPVPERPVLPQRPQPTAPATAPPAEAPPPPVPRLDPPPASRLIPEMPAPVAPGGPAVERPRETAGEIARAAPIPARPERGGLSLGGPGEPSAVPPAPPPPGESPSRRSIRDQIASLGSGLEDDPLGKETIRLDSREPRYQDYLGQLQRRIYRVWGYPDEAWSSGIGGEVLVQFTLQASGSLTGVRMVRSSGYPSLDQEALRAVKAAAPYDPLPAQMGGDPVNILGSFNYVATPRFRRN